MVAQPGHKQYVPEELQLKKTLGVRLTETDTEKLERIARQEGKTAIAYARELILRELASVQ